VKAQGVAEEEPGWEEGPQGHGQKGEPHPEEVPP
jgi:hypothetical protein